MAERVDEEELDLRKYLRIILKRKWVIMGFAFPLVAVVTLAAFKMRPVYEASAQLLIEKQRPKVMTEIVEIMPTDFREPDYYKTQYEILRSRSLARKVVKYLNLKNHSEFRPDNKSGNGLWSTLTSWMGNKADVRAGPDKRDGYSGLVGVYLSRLRIRPPRDTRLVNVTFRSYRPELAAQVANAHARMYIRQSLERRLVGSREAMEWLDKRIKEVRAKLEASQRALDRYRRENNLASLDFDQRQEVIMQKVSSFNAALVEAEKRRLLKDQLFREIQRDRANNRGLDSLPPAMTNPLILRLKEERSLLAINRHQLSQRYGPKHPKIIAIQARIREVERRIKAALAEVARGIETDYRLANAEVEKTRARLRLSQREAKDLNRTKFNYDVLKREVKTNQTLYESLVKRLKETGITEELKTSNIFIIDEAEAPTSPVYPRKRLYILLSSLVGIAGGILLAFFVEGLSNTIKTPDDVEEQLQLPFLGPIGRMKETGGRDGEPGLPALWSQDLSVSENFRTIRTNIMFSLPGPGGKSLLITSAVPREGKTTVSTNLAITLALMGKRVLLVDADLRHPKIHEALGLRPSPGLTNILIGELEWQAALQGLEDEPRDKLRVLSAGQTSPNPSELLSAEAFQQFLGEAKEQFDFILFDSSPVMTVTDPVILARACDKVVMLVRAGSTDREMVKRAIKQLRGVEAGLLGVVLNAADLARERYYYYHDKYYYYYQPDKGKGPEDRTAEP